MERSRDIEVASVDELEAEFYRSIEPEPLLLVSEWAEQRRILDRSTSGQPGPWSNDVTPYLVEVMDCLSATSTDETVVFLAGSQVGKTEVGNNWLGYIVDVAPGPTLYCLPTEKIAMNASKERLKPLFRSGSLSGKVKDSREPGASNTLLRKEFDGGFLKLVAAQAPSQLRSTPARYLLGDEVDAFPESSGDEGDPCELVARAQITFRRRKRLWLSTPTIEGHSKIKRLFKATDQRYYLLPCPHCGFEQALVWGQLRFDDAARGKKLKESVHYECSECSKKIQHSAKKAMLAKGRWQATTESADGKSVGFHLSALYSPFFSWFELAQKWIAAQGDNAALQVFINLYLAETWKEVAEAPDWNRLYERREGYERGTVPDGVVFLTAGVDVQHDRFELEVVGWGPGRESWSIDYVVVDGDTELPATQQDLFEVLNRVYCHESGAELALRKVAIDSGDRTSMVYDLVKRRAGTIAVKGRDTSQQIISAPTYMTSKSSSARRRKRSGASVYMVGTHLAKEELYTQLRLPSPIDDDPALPGFCHFPSDYTADFFKGLTAEEMVRRKNKKGYVVREWRKTAERNEPLDCRVYARAAAAEVGLDRWTPGRWTQEREQAGLSPNVFAPQAEPKRKRDRGSRSSRWDRWRK